MARDVTAAPRTLMFLGSEIDDPEKERVSRSWRQTAGDDKCAIQLFIDLKISEACFFYVH